MLASERILTGCKLFSGQYACNLICMRPSTLRDQGGIERGTPYEIMYVQEYG